MYNSISFNTDSNFDTISTSEETYLHICCNHFMKTCTTCTSSFTLGSHQTSNTNKLAKDKIDNFSRSGVEKITCGDCGKVYIGREVQICFDEQCRHMKSIQNQQKPNLSCIEFNSKITDIARSGTSSVFTQKCSFTYPYKKLRQTTTVFDGPYYM